MRESLRAYRHWCCRRHWAHSVRRHIEQLGRSRDVLGAPAVGEETIVPDAVETIGRDVDEEAANELVKGERHYFGRSHPLAR